MNLMFMLGGLLLLIMAMGALLLTERATARRRQARMAATLKPYLPSNERQAPRPSVSVIPQAAMASNVVLRTLGVRSARINLYPAPWWVLVTLVGIVATIGGAMCVAILGAWGWAMQPVIWVFGSRALFNLFAARRAKVLYQQMPDALSMIVRSVRTGMPVQEALRIVGREGLAPTAPEFDRVYNQLLIGATLTEGLVQLAARTEVPEYRFFAVALALQGQTGGSLTDTLDNLADVIRKRTALRQRAYALSSEARTTMMVLASLPVVAFGALAVLTPDYMWVLIETHGGRQIMAIAVVMMLMGIASMQFMIRKALS